MKTIKVGDIYKGKKVEKIIWREKGIGEPIEKTEILEPAIAWSEITFAESCLPTGLERFSEFEPLVNEIVANVCNKINAKAVKVANDTNSKMRYSRKFVLEEVIKKLQSLV